MYATVSPATATSETTALAGLSVPIDTRTTLGTDPVSVTLIGDGTPMSAVPDGASMLAGHTRISLDATVTSIRRRVGSTTNTRLIVSAVDVGVTLNSPPATIESSAATVEADRTCVVVGTIASPAASANVTATVFSVPATSFIPDATEPSVAVTASRAVAKFPKLTGVVAPSGAVSVASN